MRRPGAPRAVRALAAGAAGLLTALLIAAPGAGAAAAATSSSTAAASTASTSTATTGTGTTTTGATGTTAGAEDATSAVGVATSTDGVALDLLATSGSVLTPRSGFSVDLRVTGLDAASLATATVRVYAGSTPLTTEAGVQSWADGRGQVRGDVALLEQPLLAPGTTTAQTRFAVPEGALPSLGRRWGPRGITVEVVDAASRRLASQRTFVVWLPSGVPDERTGVAVLVPLSAAAAPDLGTGEVPADALTALTAEGGRLDRVLRSATGAGVAWALDPAVLGPDTTADTASAVGDEPGDAAEDATGTTAQAGAGGGASSSAAGETSAGASAGASGGASGSAPSGADGTAPNPADPGGAPGDAAPAGWLDRVRDGGRDREVVTLPRADPDVDALAGAGAPGGTALYALAEQQGRDAVRDLLGTAARTDLAWSATGTPTAGGWALAAGAGRTALVLDGTAGDGSSSSTGADGAAGDGASPTRVDVEASGTTTSAGLVPDASASRALAEGAAVGGSAALTGARLVVESALVALGDGEADASGAVPMLLTAPRTWNADPEVAVPALAALDAAPWVVPTTVSALLDAPSSATTTLEDDAAGGAGGGGASSGPVTAPAAAEPLPAAGVRAVAAAQERARATSAALADPAALLDGVSRSAVAATSSWWRTDVDGWREGVAALTTTASAVDEGVSVLRGSSVNVLSSEVALPVTIANDLDQDVTVRVSLRSTTARLQPDEEYQEVVVAAQRQQLVQLPVTAVASGDTVLTVLLTTPEGAPLGDPQVLQVRVRADWEGRGIAVAALLVGLVLVAGIVRTVRRNRRHPRLATSSGADLVDPAPGTGTAPGAGGREPGGPPLPAPPSDPGRATDPAPGRVHGQHEAHDQDDQRDQHSQHDGHDGHDGHDRSGSPRGSRSTRGT